MVTVLQYLEELYQSLMLSEKQRDEIKADREDIEQLLMQMPDIQPASVLYAGSYKKHTEIADSYDLDLILIYKSDKYSVETIHKLVFDYMRSKKPANEIRKKNVSIRWIKRPGYHLDIVPSKEIKNSTDDEVYLWKSQDKPPSKLKTSVKIHRQRIIDFGDHQLLRLLKYWRNQWGLEFPSFVLGEMVIEAFEDQSKNLSLDERIIYALEFMQDNIKNITLHDPANPHGNIVSSEDVISQTDKDRVARTAHICLNNKNWDDISEWKQLFRVDAQGRSQSKSNPPTGSFGHIKKRSSKDAGRWGMKD